MSICRGLGGSALGKLLRNCRTLVIPELAVRTKYTGKTERPPLTLIKSFWKLRLLESYMVPDSQPFFQPNRGVLDFRHGWKDFPSKQQSKADHAEDPEEMRQRQEE